MKQQEPQSDSTPTVRRAENTKEGERKETAAIPDVEEEKSSVRKWAVLSVVAVGVFMATLDSSIVNISLPAIAHYFNEPLNGAVQWTVIAYLIGTASILLTAGRLADMIGRKPVWITGLIIFTIFSAVCGAAASLNLLILARFLQGVGGALLMAIGPAMLSAAFPDTERGRALGLNAINVSLGVSIGPTLGGLLTTYFTWRWIFYVNIPVGIAGLLVAMHVLRREPVLKRGRFDPAGAILIGVGLATLTGALTFGQDLGWFSPLIICAFILGILSLAALPFVENRVANPIIIFSLLRNRVFASSIVSLILIFLAMFAVSFMLPFYLEELRSYTTATVGLILTPMSLTIACVAPFSGMLADRYGTRWLAAGGMTICCIGLVLISMLDEQSTIPDVIWRLVLVAIGQAIFMSPNNSALMGAAPPEHQGSASGFLATGRVFGQSLSIAIMGAIFTALGGAAAGQILVDQQLGGDQLIMQQQTFITAFRTTFLVCAAIAAIGIFASLVRGKEYRESRTKAGPE